MSTSPKAGRELTMIGMPSSSALFRASASGTLLLVSMMPDSSAFVKLEDAVLTSRDKILTSSWSFYYIIPEKPLILLYSYPKSLNSIFMLSI